MKKVFLPILAWGMFNGLFAQMTISPSWSIIQSPNFNLTQFAGVRFLDAVDPNVVWAIGYDGTAPIRNYCFFSKTSNGGTSWTSGVVYSSTATPAIGDTNTYVIANLDAIDANTAWVAAYMKASQNKGGIHRTTDGGATWVNMNAPGMFTNNASFCNLVCFVTNSIGIVQGDPNPGAGNEFEIWRTTDGGNTWSLVPGANIPNPLSGEYGFVDVYEKNGNSNIWFGTNKGRIFRSTDAGQTWSVSTALANSEITKIAFYDANNGLCVAYTGSFPNFTMHLLNTNDGGVTWNLIASGNSVDPNFGRNDVCGIPGTSWFASAGAGTGNMIISFSMDNGLTWNSWGGANIQYLKVDFVNSSTGWAGSFSNNTNMGGIFKYSGPNMQMPANANFSSASTVCANAPFTPTNNSTGNPAPSYTWAVSPAATISSSTAANPTITFPSAGIYTITLTAANTVTTSVTSKTVDVSTCAGIQEVKNDSPFAMIYPVPAKDQLVIALNYKAQKTLIEVKDLVGRTVKIIRVVNSNSVASDISDLSPGAYFLQINEGGNTYVKKFIKE
jgi:photosystem II stability/assembly factor-like uncharacterized protein